MLSMDKVLKAAGAEGRADRGEQEIPLVRIVGSAASQGKASDFDPGFLPVSNRTRDRWTRIYQEMAEGGELPPIDVYKLGDNYYVIDGHHRVSVARQLGWGTIKARVVEVSTRAPLGPNVDPEALLRAAEYAGFLEATQLDRVRPSTSGSPTREAGRTAAAASRSSDRAHLRPAGKRQGHAGGTDPLRARPCPPLDRRDPPSRGPARQRARTGGRPLDEGGPPG